MFNIKKNNETSTDKTVHIEKIGRGEFISFEDFRISMTGYVLKNGEEYKYELEDGRPVLPIVNHNGEKQLVEIGRIIYCYMVEDVDLFSLEPSIIYKDGNPENFRLENITVEFPDDEEKNTLQIIDLEVEDSNEDENSIDEVISELNPNESMEMPSLKEEVVDVLNNMQPVIDLQTNELTLEQINALDKRGKEIIESNFSERVNNKMDQLEKQVVDSRNIVQQERLNFEQRLAYQQAENQKLKELIANTHAVNESLRGSLYEASNKFKKIEKECVIVPKANYYSMYATMTKVLEHIDNIK